jgi:hypothetical protein
MWGKELAYWLKLYLQLYQNLKENTKVGEIYDRSWNRKGRCSGASSV